ncbi:MAG: protein-L-isoaspartate O-methyltransferase [Candidatus Poseidoniaceae archaeon]|nr:protein-L-isoaspartate O-methyltransferase [Candidatus Poseidoniaceae archaeon]
MTDMPSLLRRLQKGGIAVPPHVKKAMLEVDIADFTDYDIEPFFADRPIPFLETDEGGIKTISAPHMIATLLHHLELQKGQEVVVLGAKGGYIAALIAVIVGESGRVRLLDPSPIAVEHVQFRLTHWPTVESRVLEAVEVAPVAFPGELNRVLVTGQVRDLPVWLSSRVVDGGFALAPLGNTAGQHLMKVERQGDEMFSTDLGPVSFGPIDVKDSETGPMNPIELADLLELTIETCEELDMVDEDEAIALRDLIVELRQLPADLPPPGEGGIPMSEHPMVRLMWDASPSFLRLWPMLQLMLHPNLAQPGAVDWNEDDEDDGYRE